MDRLIVITDPDYFPGEANLLNQLFKAGLRKLHLRKPERSNVNVRQLITQISPEFRKYISVHYHPDLVEDLHLGGKHYSFTDIPRGDFESGEYSTSCSLHAWEELKELKETKINYCFISPVYNSVSKRGYTDNKALGTVPDYAKAFPVYALGGISLSNCNEVLEKGFYGIAVLGYLWEDKKDVLRRFKMLQEEIGTDVC